jgi:hypothetical protein
MARKKAEPEQKIVAGPGATRTAELPGVDGPGVSPKQIAEVEKLADAYVDARDARMRRTEVEVAAKDKLAEALHKHAKEIGQNPETGEIRYVYRGGDKDRRVISLKPSDERLNVKDVEAFEE